VSSDEAGTGRSERPAFYALAPGGLRDYWTLLHPPYTLWHLSYVVMGAALAPTLNVGLMIQTVAAFLLAMGVAAHALDELHGRPLGTLIPSGVLQGLAALGLAGAVALGVHAAIVGSVWIWPCIVVGGFLAVAYNLELFGGRFHSDLWFALAWGGFPVLTAYIAQTGSLHVDALALTVACAAISAAQRVLSTPVRRLRRHAERVEGTIEYADGTREPIDSRSFREAPEGALRWLSIAMPLLAVASVAARLG
jgi:hypothetical protein